jgi:hypothetical protein
MVRKATAAAAHMQSRSRHTLAASLAHEQLAEGAAASYMRQQVQVHVR